MESQMVLNWNPKGVQLNFKGSQRDAKMDPKCCQNGSQNGTENSFVSLFQNGPKIGRNEVSEATWQYPRPDPKGVQLDFEASQPDAKMDPEMVPK